MREIKFRCWHKNGKHLYGMTFAPAMMYDETPGDCLKWKADRQEIESIMQFTGLSDKNGKEIYEGDIVKHAPHGYEQRILSVVEYFEAGFMPFADSDDNAPYPDSDKTEVIGNIYENPELLTKDGED